MIDTFVFLFKCTIIFISDSLHLEAAVSCTVMNENPGYHYYYYYQVFG